VSQAEFYDRLPQDDDPPGGSGAGSGDPAGGGAAQTQVQDNTTPSDEYRLLASVIRQVKADAEATNINAAFTNYAPGTVLSADTSALGTLLTNLITAVKADAAIPALTAFMTALIGRVKADAWVDDTTLAWGGSANDYTAGTPTTADVNAAAALAVAWNNYTAGTPKSGDTSAAATVGNGIIGRVKADASATGEAVEWSDFSTPAPTAAMQDTLALLMARHAARSVQPFIAVHGRATAPPAQDDIRPLPTVIVNTLSSASATFNTALYTTFAEMEKLAAGDVLVVQGHDITLSTAEAKTVNADVTITTYKEDGSVNALATVTFDDSQGYGYGEGMEVSGAVFAPHTTLIAVEGQTLVFNLSQEPTAADTDVTVTIPAIIGDLNTTEAKGFGAAGTVIVHEAVIYSGGR
jgi:hypothetical protein